MSVKLLKPLAKDFSLHNFKKRTTHTQLVFSNLSASEKSSVEDDIRRYKALNTSASRRSHTAQVCPGSFLIAASVLTPA